MQTIFERVRRTLRTHRLIAPSARVVVGVSGGADSVALARILRDLAPAAGFMLAALAHLNHELRGAASDADEAFCQQLADTLGVAFVASRSDVRALARKTGRSIEHAARTARYAFLGETADRLGADRIAVGHTRNDQAETFLLRLLRGAGPSGLAGIRPQAGRVIRPLLDVSRDDVLRYLNTVQAGYREDESNADVTIPRNRIRHELMPFLRDRFSPAIVEVLAREAAIAREDADWLEQGARAASAGLVLQDAGGIVIEAERLAAQPLALARRIAHRVLSTFAGGRFVGFEHVAGLLAFAAAGPLGPALLDLPGQRAIRSGTHIHLRPTLVREVSPGRMLDATPLPVPGAVEFEPGWFISAETDPAMAERQAGLEGRTDVVAVTLPPTPLTVRRRRPGDRFRPLGLNGRKKLQDFFVDRKIPRHLRDCVPLVVDAHDRIVWVVGEAISEDFKVTGGSAAVILLRARRSGGTG